MTERDIGRIRRDFDGGIALEYLDLRALFSALDAAEAECVALRSAITTQAAAVRRLGDSRAHLAAHDQRVLGSLAAHDRSELLRWLDAAREESVAWNARATALEAERDASIERELALRSAMVLEREASVRYEQASDQSGPRCLTPAEIRAAVVERASARAVVDALVTKEVL